jgi:HEAT repeat protein
MEQQSTDSISEAASELGTLGNPQAIEPLRRVWLCASDESVRSSAKHALERLENH